MILLPKTTTEEEFSFLKRELKDCRVEIFDSRVTAFGNTILMNNKGALIYPDFTEAEVKFLKNITGLDDIEKGSIANIVTVGAVGAVNDKGGLTHIETSEEEIKRMEKIFKVNFDIGTINFGNTFIKSGIIVNNKGILIGSRTTGPEILRIQKAFGE